MANLGVPVKLLHESLGHIITVELKTGEVGHTRFNAGGVAKLTGQMYRGKLMEGDYTF